MPPSESESASDSPEGASSGNSLPNPLKQLLASAVPNTVEKIDEQKLALVEQLRRLEEARQKIEPRPPTLLSQITDANVPAAVAAGTTEAFKALALRGNEESFYRDIIPDLAHRVSVEIFLFVQKIFARRIQSIVQHLDITPVYLAMRAGFENQLQMHDNIIEEIQGELLGEYLPQGEEKLREVLQLPPIEKVEHTIDKLLFPDEELSNVPPHTMDEHLNSNAIDDFKGRTIYFWIWEIMRHSALANVQRKLSQEEERKVMEAYTWAEAGVSFDELTQLLTAQVEKTFIRTGPMFVGRDVWHTCGNAIARYFGKFKQGRGLSGEERRQEILQAETSRTIQQCSLESSYVEQGKLGKKAYRPLKPKERAVTGKVGVRLAGHDDMGNFTQEQLDADILSAQRVEENLTRWMEPLLDQPNRGYLLPEETAGVETFMTQGGHASRFTSDQFKFIQHHGVVLLLELEVRENVKLVLGTISALSRALCAPKPGAKDSAEWHNQQQATDLLPQYDLRDLDFTDAVDEKERERFFVTAGRKMQICRSSMIETLDQENFPQLKGVELPEGWENLTLRRMGLVALLKCIVLMLGKDWSKDTVTFNIGTVAGMGYLGVNNPSLHHNSWASPFMQRKLFTPIKDGINISWMAYKAEIEDAIDEVCRIIYGKQGEWNIQKIEHLKAMIYMQLDIRRAAGLHAPF